MRLALFNLMGICLLTGCTTRSLPVRIQQEGIRAVTSITLPIEEYPLAVWWTQRESVLARVTPHETASMTAFNARKMQEWQQFVAIWHSEDGVFRVQGSYDAVFDYFVIVRHGKEVRRYYVYGGDGILAVE